MHGATFPVYEWQRFLTHPFLGGTFSTTLSLRLELLVVLRKFQFKFVVGFNRDQGLQISSVCRGRSSSWSTTGQEVVARFEVSFAASELHNLPRELTALINRGTFANNMQKRSQISNAFPRVRGVGLVGPWVPSSTSLRRLQQTHNRHHASTVDLLIQGEFGWDPEEFRYIDFLQMCELVHKTMLTPYHTLCLQIFDRSSTMLCSSGPGLGAPTGTSTS